MPIKHVVVDVYLCIDLRDGSFYRAIKPRLQFRNLEKVTFVETSFGMQPDHLHYGPSTFIPRADDPICIDYCFSPPAKVSTERDVEGGVELLEIWLRLGKDVVRRLALDEHRLCAPSCTHSDNWKVPEAELKLKIPFEITWKCEGSR
jgi:hypothetical protein